MHHFSYLENRLYCEDVSIETIAREVGTPCYIYSHATLTRHFEVFDSAFKPISHLTCFAVKANSNIGILNILGRLGAGMDIVSGGELYRVRKASIPAESIVYSGVGKTIKEIDYALSEGILMFNIESSQELEVINSRAGALGVKAPISIRINPDVDPQTHPYISTGLRKNKFGIDVDLAFQEYIKASILEHVDIVGVDCHIGSQLTELSPFVDALRRMKILISKLDAHGINIRYLDIGGGLGIPYNSEEPPHPKEYAEALIKELAEASYTLILEPGRVIVGNAGVLVTQILYKKETPNKKFLIVDAAMNDLIRPSLYGSYHVIQPAVKHEHAEKDIVDVVGPICESGDFLAKDRVLQRSNPGDLLAVMSAGAYGFTMASNYNSRPRPAEVIVKGSTYEIIRERESWEDLVRLERIPSF